MLRCAAAGRCSSPLIGRLRDAAGVRGCVSAGAWTLVNDSLIRTRFERDRLIGNLRQRKSLFSTGARLLPERRRRRKEGVMSMSEGGEGKESGYQGAEVGGSEGVNGGLSLQQGGGGGAGEESSVVVIDHGFTRPEMYTKKLVGTVNHYERHVFLCYKEPDSWPARVEASEFDRLPRFFVAALRARKNDMQRKTRLTICEGRDGTGDDGVASGESFGECGDVLIFPEMIRYRDLTHFDVDTFVEDVFVQEKDWVGLSKPEPLEGSYIFVCAHGNRDARCGECGPVLIKRFQDEIALRGLTGQIFVLPCSHIGGHKYAGNVIIFSSKGSYQVSGHWYGYVVPEDVPELLDQHIGKGELIERIWRGQMGLAEEDQKLAQEKRLRCEREGSNGCPCSENQNGGVDREGQLVAPCCQTRKYEADETSQVTENGHYDTNEDTNGDVYRAEVSVSPKADHKSIESAPVKTWAWGFLGLPKWVETWEREDTQAAVAVLGAAALVTVAVQAYKRSAAS